MSTAEEQVTGGSDDKADNCVDKDCAHHTEGDIQGSVDNPTLDTVAAADNPSLRVDEIDLLKKELEETQARLKSMEETKERQNIAAEFNVSPDLLTGGRESWREQAENVSKFVDSRLAERLEPRPDRVQGATPRKTFTRQEATHVIWEALDKIKG